MASQVTTSADRIVEIERRIAARPEIVFSYFIDAERFIRWQGIDAQLDPQPGGIFRVTVTGRSHMVARGEFVEIDPPRRVVFTWGWEPKDFVADGATEVAPGSSRVEVELEPDGDSTLLRLRHSGLPTDPAERFHQVGWDLVLDRLTAVAAGADPGPDLLAER